MPILRPLVILAVATGWALSGADARSDQAENLRRLASMPLEHRRALAKDLERFEAMGPAEKEAVRALDRELAGRSESDRARYHSVLRRYHLWLQRLPKEQRDAITAAQPEERVALVRKFRAEELASDARRKAPLFLQVVDLGDMSPFDVAEWLKIWLVLTPSERPVFEKIPPFPGPWRQKFLNDLDPPRTIDPPKVQLTKYEEQRLVEEMMGRREFREWLPDDLRKLLMSLRNPEVMKDGGVRKEQRNESRGWPSPWGRNSNRTSNPEWRAIMIHCLAGNYHFIVNPPHEVSPTNLFRFQSTLPTKIRESFTYLPPEEARRRLTILYRLIHPHPDEMPLSADASKHPSSPPTPSTGNAGKPSPKPAATPTETSPF